MLGDFLSFSFTWYNLPFTLMLGLGVVIAGLQLIGLSQDGDTDMDTNTDADIGADADINPDLHNGLDAETGSNPDIDPDLELMAHHPIEHGHVSDNTAPDFSWLAFIGIGKAPLMVVLLIILMTTGILGWLFNGLATSLLGYFPGMLLVGTFLGSLVAGSLVTSRISRFIGHALPPVSTTATRAQGLVGRHGTVISPFVDGRYGMVHLRDDGGTLISVFAVTDDEQPIPRGESVILLTYEATQRLYQVTRR